jgi:hypothetical protein
MSQKYGRGEIPKKLSQKPSKNKTKKEPNIHYCNNVEYSRIWRTWTLRTSMRFWNTKNCCVARI